MVAELIIGVGCIALGFYAVYKLSDNCILIVYRRDRDSDVTTRHGSRRRHFSFGRTIRDAMQTLRERGSLDINVGSNRGGSINGSHNWSISRLASRRESQRSARNGDAVATYWLGLISKANFCCFAIVDHCKMQFLVLRMVYHEISKACYTKGSSYSMPLWRQCTDAIMRTFWGVFQ